MSIFRRKGPSLTGRQRLAQRLNQAVLAAPPAEIDALADRVYELIPVLMAVANRTPTALFAHMREIIVSEKSSLVWGVLSGSELLTEIIEAFGTHAPDIQRIIRQQAERYKSAQVQAATPPALEAVPARDVR
jgi:hypothetical protein